METCPISPDKSKSSYSYSSSSYDYSYSKDHSYSKSKHDESCESLCKDKTYSQCLNSEVCDYSRDDCCEPIEECCEEEIRVIIPWYQKETILFPNQLLTTANYYRPFMSYKHRDFVNCMGGSRITGGIPYRGSELKGFEDKYLFGDWTQPMLCGAHLGVGNIYSTNLVSPNKCDLEKMHKIELVDIHERFQNSGYYVSMGTDFKKSRIFLGTYGGCGVSKTKLGKVYELVATKSGYSTAGYFNPDCNDETNDCSLSFSSESQTYTDRDFYTKPSHSNFTC